MVAEAHMDGTWQHHYQAHFRDVTGGVYKARERIHRGMLIHDY